MNREPTCIFEWCEIATSESHVFAPTPTTWSPNVAIGIDVAAKESQPMRLGRSVDPGWNSFLERGTTESDELATPSLRDATRFGGLDRPAIIVEGEHHVCGREMACLHQTTSGMDECLLMDLRAAAGVLGDHTILIDRAWTWKR